MIKDCGLGRHNPDEDGRICIDILKAKIENGASLSGSSRFHRVDNFAGLGVKNGEFLADYDQVMGRIVDSHSHDRESNGARTCMAIVDHGNPGTWHGTPATVPMSLCAYDVEVFDGLLGALDRLPRVCLMAIDGVGG